MKKIVLLVIAMLLCMTSCGLLHTHAYGSWQIVQQATCVNDGLQERVCSCGAKETAVIAKTGHEYFEATCQAPQTCRYCQQTKGERLEHTLGGTNCEHCGLNYLDALGALIQKYGYEFSTGGFGYSPDWRADEIVCQFSYQPEDRYVSLFYMDPCTEQATKYFRIGINDYAIADQVFEWSYELKVQSDTTTAKGTIKGADVKKHGSVLTLTQYKSNSAIYDEEDALYDAGRILEDVFEYIIVPLLKQNEEGVTIAHYGLTRYY